MNAKTFFAERFLKHRTLCWSILESNCRFCHVFVGFLMFFHKILSFLPCFWGIFDDFWIPDCRFLLCFVGFSRSLGQWWELCAVSVVVQLQSFGQIGKGDAEMFRVGCRTHHTVQCTFQVATRCSVPSPLQAHVSCLNKRSSGKWIQRNHDWTVGISVSCLSIFSTGSACSPRMSIAGGHSQFWFSSHSFAQRQHTCGHSVNLTQLVFPVWSGTLIVLSDCLLVFLFSLILQQFPLFFLCFHFFPQFSSNFPSWPPIFRFFQRFLARVTRLHVTPFHRDDWIPQANATCCERRFLHISRHF